MKAYIKSVFRMLYKQKTRIFVILSIVAVGISLSTGLGSLPNQLIDTYNAYLEKYNHSDLIIKSTSQTGFTEDDINKLKELTYIKDYEITSEYDSRGSRYIFSNLSNRVVSKLELIEGKLPTTANEVVVERKTNSINSYNIGDTLTFQNNDFIVVGIVVNPNMLYQNDIPSLEEGFNLKDIIYFDNQFNSFPIDTDIYIRLNTLKNYFSNDYKDYNKAIKTDLEKTLGENFVVLGFDEIVTFVIVDEYIGKMEVISLIFPIFFVVVIMIVLLTTMIRLIENDRLYAGTFEQLGYSKFKIVIRYFIIVILADLIGSFIGITIGYELISKTVFDAFGQIIYSVPLAKGLHIDFGLIVASIIFGLMLITIFFVANNLLKEKPSELLRPKAPKKGTKIFLEKIPFIWNRLKFKYKSTSRNLLRYPLHFAMTIISIVGSSALVLAGLGLYENTLLIEGAYAESIKVIALMIVIAAAALSILVTYNLTNMNIEERQREIATLKVLGYNRKEVAMYIFREVFITSTIAILIGIPTGIGLIGFVFDYIDFGLLENISIWTYLIAILSSYMFILITDLILVNKINNIDMNASLKTLE